MADRACGAPVRPADLGVLGPVSGGAPACSAIACLGVLGPVSGATPACSAIACLLVSAGRVRR
ncbi:MAG: hypothetical protein M0013_04055, partial [Actinomycetota bacterium]|nr:hypothetical protein [Actinomycetota bacterium]